MNREIFIQVTVNLTFEYIACKCNFRYRPTHEIFQKNWPYECLTVHSGDIIENIV